MPPDKKEDFGEPRSVSFRIFEFSYLISVGRDWAITQTKIRELTLPGSPESMTASINDGQQLWPIQSGRFVPITFVVRHFFNDQFEGASKSRPFAVANASAGASSDDGAASVTGDSVVSEDSAVEAGHASEPAQQLKRARADLAQHPAGASDADSLANNAFTVASDEDFELHEPDPQPIRLANAAIGQL